MAKFKAFNKQNPCPVCGKAGKCKETEDGGILCMTAKEPGWHPDFKFVKITANGLWGVHYPYTQQDFDREQWQAIKAERESEAIEIERERLAKCLSAEQRDSEIRKVLSQLTLGDNDNRYLLSRGVPESVVSNCRSVSQWQALGERVHVNLPGVWSNGRGLSNAVDGILVPVIGINGLFTAMRLHDPMGTINGTAKYRWLSSPKRNLSPKLVDGSYPVAVCLPVKWKYFDRVGLCEGVEWKAQSAANRLGYPVIGFSGSGDMPKLSQAKLTAIIDYLKSVNGQFTGDRLTLIPDAGMERNRQVMAFYRETLANVKHYGYGVTVEWWGQGTSKSKGDIDEIGSEIKVREISVDEFLGAKRNTLQQAFTNLTSALFGGTKAKSIGEKIQPGLIKSKINHLYKPGEGAKLYESLARSGAKWILDISQTGAGKTFTVSDLNKGAMFLLPDGEDVITRLFYCPPSYRNPTNAKIEEYWYETPARNQGYYLNYAKTTELGNPYRESLNGLGEVDDHERTSSNCQKASVFHAHYAAGRSPEGICKGCDLREKCAVKRGDGYGYISEVKEWITHDKIRTSAQWLDKEKVLLALAGLIFDEAGQAPFTLQTTVDIEFLKATFTKVRRANKALYKKYKLGALLESIDDLIYDGVPTYGYDTAQLQQRLELVDNISEALDELLQIELDMRGHEEIVDDVDPVFLYDLIRVIKGTVNGSLCLTKNTLTIQTRNERLIQACHAAKFVICQDATWSRSAMAMALGINEDDIIVICQESSPVTNLVVEQWKGAGLLSNNRTEAQISLAGIIRDHLTGDGVGFIEWKKYANASDLIHCGDSRGSNAYKEMNTVVSMGLSRPNMTAVRLEYETISGRVIKDFSDVGFSDYYSHAIAANLVQEIGRLRANRRPSEQLKFVLVGDGNITFLEDLGFNLVTVDASQKLGIDLGKVGARARYLNLGMRLCRQLGRELWLSLSMDKMGEFLERAGSSISRWVNRWFGVEGDTKGIAYQRFKAMVDAAIHGHTYQAPMVLDEEQLISVDAVQMMLMQSKFVGKELGRELQIMIDVMGWELFLESVRGLKDDYGIKLIARIFDVALSV